jgi:integrase
VSTSEVLPVQPPVSSPQSAPSSLFTFSKNTYAHSGDKCSNVSPETNPCTPSERFEKMARRRFQNPEPFKEGAFWWILHWQDDFINGKHIRKRKRVKLAPVTMPLREVKKVAAEIINPINQGLVTTGSATNFREYVNNTYQQNELPLMAKSTQQRYKGIIKNYLVPTFGDSCLRDLTPLTLQRYFSGMADSPLSHESKDKIRDVLSSILGSAKKYGLLLTNPIEDVKLPPSRKGNRNKPYITPQQFNILIQLIPEPYASMVFVAVHTGLRVSELIGLRWKNVHADSITIDERYCRGDWGCPKSEASNATIAVNSAVIDRIQRLKTLTIEVRAGRAVRNVNAVKSAKPDDLVFQSLMAGKPMRDNNILTRHIKPAARKLGLDFVNWRCLRTSHATWLKMVGADVKDAQAQMRHSRASTTMDIYQQFVPESQRKFVNMLGGFAASA